MNHHFALCARAAGARPSYRAVSVARRARLRGRWLLMLALLAAVFWGGFYFAGGRGASRPQHEVAAFVRLLAKPVGWHLPPERPDEFHLFKHTQAALVTSPLAISAALRDPKIAALPMLHGRAPAGAAPIDWLARQVKVSFPGDGSLMQIAMEGDDPAQLQQAVDAIVSAYLKETIAADRALDQQRLAALQDRLQRNRAEIKELRQRTEALAVQTGSPESPEVRLKLESTTRELAALHTELIEARRELRARKLAEAELVERANQARASTPQVAESKVNDRLQISTEFQETQRALDDVRRALAMRKSEANGEPPAELTEKLAELTGRLHALRSNVEQELIQRAKAEQARTLDEELAAQRVALDLRERQLKELTVGFEELQRRALAFSRSSADVLAQLALIAELEEATRKLAAEHEVLKEQLELPPRVQRFAHATMQADRG